MKTNMGGADRIIRMVIAVVISILIFTNYLTGTWALILGTLGAVFAATSVLGFCPLYKLVGFSTCKNSSLS